MPNPTDNRPDNSPEPFRQPLRVALCQLHFHPATVYRFEPEILQPLREPVYVRSPTESLVNHVLGSLASTSVKEETINHLQEVVRKVYLDFLLRRVTFILEQCRAWRVELAVFPEYSIPGEILLELEDSAKGMNVIFGSHCVTRFLAKKGLYERLLSKKGPYKRLESIEANRDEAVVPVLTSDGQWTVGAHYLPGKELTWVEPAPFVTLPDGIKLLILPDQQLKTMVQADSLRKALVERAIVVRIYSSAPASGPADSLDLEQVEDPDYVLRVLPSTDINLSHAGPSKTVTYPVQLKCGTIAPYLERIGIVDIDRAVLGMQRSIHESDMPVQVPISVKEVNTLHLIPHIGLHEYRETVDTFRSLSEKESVTWLESREALLEDWARRLAGSPDPVHGFWRTRLRRLLDPHLPVGYPERQQNLTGFVPLPRGCPSAVELDWGLGVATEAVLTERGLVDGDQAHRLTNLLQRYGIGRNLALEAAPPVVQTVAEELRTRFSQASPELPATSAHPECPASPPFKLLELDVKNLRRFSRLSIVFPGQAEEGEKERGQWLVLLGDNGTGKTTLLQAIVLALIGDDDRSALLTGASAPFVRVDEAHARVSVSFFWEGEDWQKGLSVERGAEREVPRPLPGRDMETPDEHIRREDSIKASRSPASTIPLYAYGCHRTPGPEGQKQEAATPFRNVSSLFDPEARLIGIEGWMTRMAFLAARQKGETDIKQTEHSDKPGKFLEAVIGALRRALPGVQRIEPGPDGFWEVEGAELPRTRFSALSDGYLTTAGWVLDLIARHAERASRFGLLLDEHFAERMTGLVILDELDLHLHPLWQTHVVRDLREIFPRMSFIVTTHNPLPLLGANPGEVQVLWQDPDTNTLMMRAFDLPPGIRADQVLTGPWFRLSSTLDSDTLSKLERHRLMLRASTPETDPERLALEAELRQRLGRYAETSIERMALSIADEETDKAYPDMSLEERKRLQERLRKRLAERLNKKMKNKDNPVGEE